MGRKDKIVSLENNAASSIGARMRLARLAKEISLTDMARAVGYTKSRLSTVENGYGRPSQELVQAYEQVLLLEAGELMRTPDDQPAPVLGHRHSALPDSLSAPRTPTSPLGRQVPGVQGRERVGSVLQEYAEETPRVGSFYGREAELAQLQRWIEGGDEDQRRRVVTLLGMGGMGKTMLAAELKERVKDQFEFVYWRTLQNAPPVEELLKHCIEFFSSQEHIDLPEDFEEQVKLLLNYLRTSRSLIVFDNVETILEGRQNVGQYRKGYEGYGNLIAQIGESEHRGYLLLTSRELPVDVLRLEEGNAAYTLQLAGVGLEEGKKILHEKGLRGSDQDYANLVTAYAGNPLALKLVAGPIREIFGGEIPEFLAERGVVIGDIYDLIDRQFLRLSAQEREIIYWLALACEPITLNDVIKAIVRPVPKRELLEALDSLRRRSLIENTSGSRFTLQPVIMEYVTDDFVGRACSEIDGETFVLLASHALIRAEAKDHIRNNQIRLFLEPVVLQLLSRLGKIESERKLKDILARLRTTRPQTPEYAAGNLLNLLVQLKVDMRGYDFSNLVVWNGYLQETTLPEVNFSHTRLERTVFIDTFGSILSIALSGDGHLLAAATANSEVRLWNVHSTAPMGICQGHTDWVRSVDFSPDGSMVMSGGDDQTIRLWDVRTAQCLKTLYGHTDRVRSVRFGSDNTSAVSVGDDQTVRLWDVWTGECIRTYVGHTGRVWSVAINMDCNTIVSGSNDQTAKIWDIESGMCLQTLPHKKRVYSVALSPDGSLLATGGDDQIIYLWERETGQLVRVFSGHTGRIWSIRFSPDGRKLASGSDDKSIRLWDIESGECVQTMRRHTNRVWSVAFDPEGETLISGGDDQTVRMWSTGDGECYKTIQGHSSRIRSVAFSPDGEMLASGSDDRILRLWSVSTGQPLKALYGHSTWIYSVAFSPGGTLLASGSDDQTIRLWDVQTGYCLRVLNGHSNWVRSVAFSKDGTRLVSGSDDQTVRLWQVSTGQCLDVLQEECSRIWSVALSSDDRHAACGGEDRIVRLWDIDRRESLQLLHGHENRVRSVAFSPDGRLLASSSDDWTIRLWEVSSGRCLNILKGHRNWVWSVAFSPDGSMLVSGGDDHGVHLWRMPDGEPLWAGFEHSKRIYSVAFSPHNALVASGSYDGSIKLWDVDSGQCVRTLRRERPYEGMNITGVSGLSPAQKAMLRTLGAVEE